MILYLNPFLLFCVQVHVHPCVLSANKGRPKGGEGVFLKEEIPRLDMQLLRLKCNKTTPSRPLDFPTLPPPPPAAGTRVCLKCCRRLTV